MKRTFIEKIKLGITDNLIYIKIIVNLFLEQRSLTKIALKFQDEYFKFLVLDL